MEEFSVTIKALTPIWTGDADKKCSTLRETGIIGSLRWWYEALVRGLGGCACDPTEENLRCKLEHDKFYKALKSGKTISEALNEQICPTCQLFGCTGWSRKFKLEVGETTDEVTLKFIELKKIEKVEWDLLNRTLTIISDFGAIGGKLSEANYGVIQIKENNLNRKHKYISKKEELDHYLNLKEQGRSADNPNLSRFIFINTNTDENLINGMVKEIKRELSFLKGSKNKGKKYFYKKITKNNGRFFAYAENSDEYSKIVEFLSKKSIQYMEGVKILEGLK
ncbi:MAG: type III-B CRISPR module RAMP protein Cmr1 [Candidatus Atribacteria bacterium]|nr:type III-B CRISPR module RAMP protein Cmr1 [Candidatus Atribacteria bacterium]